MYTGFRWPSRSHNRFPSELPVVPLRGAVVLPLSVSPLGVNRPMSVEAVNRALAGDRMVLTLLQMNDTDEPGPDDLHKVGTVCIIRQMAKGQTGMRVLVEGVARARAEFLQTERGVMQALRQAAQGACGADRRRRRARASPSGAGRPRSEPRHGPVA